MKDQGIVVLRTNGDEEWHRATRGPLLAQVYALIHATTVDVVNLRDGRVMLVDDHGYETTAVERPSATSADVTVELVPTRARKPVNPKATALYHAICRPGVTHQIVGDVAIVHDEDLA